MAGFLIAVLLVLGVHQVLLGRAQLRSIALKTSRSGRSGKTPAPLPTWMVRILAFNWEPLGNPRFNAIMHIQVGAVFLLGASIALVNALW